VNAIIGRRGADASVARSRAGSEDEAMTMTVDELKRTLETHRERLHGIGRHL